MPPPIRVELEPHNPAWAEDAQREAARLALAIGATLVTVHHIGSTAIPGIQAKPILDLLPVVVDIAELNANRARLEALGYAAWGEYGLPGRRCFTLNDAATARRKVQLHCYQADSPEIERHLAFRDYLRARADLARDYEAEKCRCRDRHPLDSHAYTECKSQWIRRIEAEALGFLRAKWMA